VRSYTPELRAENTAANARRLEQAATVRITREASVAAHWEGVHGRLPSKYLHSYARNMRFLRTGQAF
jgi:hypothetical protein